MSETHLTDIEFAALPLHDALRVGIENAGFKLCTPIQASTLPVALAGHDVAGQAQTGTGKTAAFLLALFDRLLRNPPGPERRQNDILALIIAPTRELAVQIHADAQVLGAGTGLRMGLAFGGTDYDKQRRALQDGLDVLIGTPGRVIDYLKQRVFGMGSVQVAVLDEADRMFDLGFIKDIRFLLRRMPPPGERLNMLFSATLSHRVMELAYEHMNDPELVRIEPEKVTADKVRQIVYFPSNEEKLPLLIGLLKQMDADRTMVFVNTKREAERVQCYLEANGIHALAISGDVPQRKRLRMLGEFQSGALKVLIGTDVASRGLHIPGVSHVFNFDLPQDREDYVHRIGRTARVGTEGDAISFGCEDYVVSLPDIEDYIGFRLPVGTVEPEMLAKDIVIPPRPPRRPRADNRGGGRRGGGPGPRRGGDRHRGGESRPGSAPSKRAAARGDDKPQQDSSAGDGPPKKKRRRRRRRSGGSQQNPGGGSEKTPT